MPATPTFLFHVWRQSTEGTSKDLESHRCVQDSQEGRPWGAGSNITSPKLFDLASCNAAVPVPVASLGLAH